MNEEERGFTVKDRRSFDEKGEAKEKEKGAEEIKKEKEPKEQAKKDETRQTPLPEANFTSLIFSLSSSALLHFGEIADPNTGEKTQDLPLAKHAIDTLSMLQEKTQGNLTDEEQKFLDSVLTDLKWRFVKAAK